MKKLTISFLLLACFFFSGCGLWSNRFEENFDNNESMIQETFTLDSDSSDNGDTTTDEDKSDEKEDTDSSSDTEEDTMDDDITTEDGENNVDSMKAKDMELIIEKLQDENEALNEVVKSMENEALSSQDILDRAEKTQLSFKSCGFLSAYSSFDWYNKLENLLEKQKFPLHGRNEIAFIYPDMVTSSCYSENGELFIFVVTDDQEGSFGVMRYDIKLNSLGSSHILKHDVSKIAIPTEFGKRNGNTISLESTLQEDGCVHTMSYEYNFVKNETNLVKNCSRCGQEEETCKIY